MDRKLPRRGFIGRLLAATIFTALPGACGPAKQQEDPASPDEYPGGDLRTEDSGFRDKLAENRTLPRELVMQLLDQKVDRYMQLSHHCAQSSFLALKEQFGLREEGIVKALTPVTGIAERGETCGAVTGPLLALGLVYGRGPDQLNDWDAYRGSLLPAGHFCTLFEKEYGSTQCRDIQNVKFGKCFRLTNPEELREFQQSGATEQCSAVVRRAVRIAATILLDDTAIN